MRLQLSFVVLLPFVTIVGCQSAPRSVVVIDRGFLATVGDNPSDDWYVDHYPELMYLCMKDDRDAVCAALAVIASPNVRHVECAGDNGLVLLAEQAYNQADWGEFWDALSRLKPEIQARVLHYYDRLVPVDWAEDRDAYLMLHPTTGNFYQPDAD